MDYLIYRLTLISYGDNVQIDFRQIEKFTEVNSQFRIKLAFPESGDRKLNL